MEEDLVEARRRSQRRLQLTFESIIERYSQVADDETDEVDLLTGQVVVDRGYLRSRVTNTPHTVPHATTTPPSHPGIAAPELARTSRRRLFRPAGDVEGDEAGSSGTDVSSDEVGEESDGTVETADEAEDEDGEDALEAEWEFLNDSLDASTLSPALRRLTRRWLSGKSSSQSGLPRSLTFTTRKATPEALGHRPSAERTPTSNSEPEDVKLALSSAAAPLHLPPGPSLSATSPRALVPGSGSEDGGDEADLFLHDTGFTSALGHVLASARRRLEASSRPDQWSPTKAPLPTTYKAPSSAQVPPSPACVRTSRPMNPDWYYEMFGDETADDSGDDALDGTLVDGLPPSSTPGKRPNSSIIGAAPNSATSKRRWVSPDRRGPRMHSAATEIMDKDNGTPAGPNCGPDAAARSPRPFDPPILHRLYSLPRSVTSRHASSSNSGRGPIIVPDRSSSVNLCWTGEVYQIVLL
ncbi:hypothetical protein IWQ60_005383 [Tieghemiomyces parasiticus]|uniref:Uncharacterized protein n=1 Tax=Tieghemiomyces parasiticus TaxID=78921 RepID=A0A9W8ACG4_9FUNG|nr:hypothetical protein IWQ60_005383 [Tieghemiomyces parasiticus]